MRVIHHCSRLSYLSICKSTNTSLLDARIFDPYFHSSRVSSYQGKAVKEGSFTYLKWLQSNILSSSTSFDIDRRFHKKTLFLLMLPSLCFYARLIFHALYFWCVVLSCSLWCKALWPFEALNKCCVLLLLLFRIYMLPDHLNEGSTLCGRSTPKDLFSFLCRMT